MPWISEDMDISTVLVKLPTGQTVRYGSAMTQQAKKIMDIVSGTLQAWCRGLKSSEIEMAINFLVKQNIIASYDLPDPKDKKSKYTFYTLAINKDSLWGTKQFKTKK